MIDRGLDMSGQERAENRVTVFREALGPFVVAAESACIPMIFTDQKMPGHPIVFANESFASLTGLGRQDVLGIAVAQFLRQITDAQPVSALDKAIASGEGGIIETPCRKANGEEYLARIYYSPVHDEENVIRQYFFCFTPINGRVDRILGEVKLLDELYGRAPGIIATTAGPDHRFTYANDSYKNLIGRFDIVGKTVETVLPEVISQGIVNILDEVYRSGEPFVGDHMPMDLGRGNGSAAERRYLNLVYQPVRDDLGEVRGLFLEGNDVTVEHTAAEQLALLQNELAHASRVNAMGMMAATIAHELNQPLAAIVSYSGASQRLVDPDSRNGTSLSDALRAIEEAADRAGQIIRHLREMTKRGSPSRSPFNVKDAITASAQLVRAGGCGNTGIETHSSADLEVLGDRVQIEQVIVNLLRNSCDAVGHNAGGRVVVAAGRAADKIWCSVSDNGPGLTPEEQQQLFTWTNSPKPGGNGLGLAICRTIIEAHGGKIWLEQTGDDRTQFRFVLPAALPGR